MELLSNLAGGFAQAFTLTNLFYCFLGVTVGTFVGVLPGIGSMIGIAVLLPLTFYLTPEAALVMLAGIYYGGEYGGSIASILINMPGSASTAVTCIDGHQMTRKGRAGVALFVTAVASFIGGSFGIILMTVFSPALATFSLAFGPADYFAVMILGLIASATVGQSSPLKNALSVVIGVLLGLVGTDINTGIQRYMGFILGPLMEEHLRRALLLSYGDLTVFVREPISASVLAVTALILVLPAIGWWKRSRARTA
ncbi:tripartite tricarboxylate transporter permease [Pelagibacterium lacus]|uniref:DUF112 domain-containing protein n=1 Tax=Pelagibacterium lacus TaxID=2282655 RepID=A0A369W6W9_9HYPH|nr:tripartite tricarboxylate transporter permease [Pelagibacterium lacus]RDE07821.1 hypothetical protein DVH29_14765 [Pelagibacterium lacus]